MNEDHTLIRATLVSAIVGLIAGYYGISENDALAKFYSTKTAAAFADDGIGLYGCSALNIAGDVVMECDGTLDASRFLA